MARPDVAFKLAVFATDGPERVGILIDNQLFDVQQARTIARTPQVFLKPGDTVAIEVEGIGTLVTPIE